MLVLPRSSAALFNLREDPSVCDGPKLLPLVPWLFALLALAPGAPPVPFTVTPLLSVVPDPGDLPPVEVPSEELPEEVPDEPPAAVPPELPPPLWAITGEPASARPATSTTEANFMADPFGRELANVERSASFPPKGLRRRVSR